MKATIRKNLILSVPILIIFSICLIVNGINSHRLSDEEIAVLREQYPVCGVDVPEGISMKKASINEVKSAAETFVYGEVVGDMKTYSVKLSTGNSMLDQKRENNGISEEYDFYEYTISVISDTEGKKEKGENLTITANKIFKNYNPQLREGMKIVVPVVTDDDNQTRNHYIVDGMYYVTEDGYAISAFEESTVYSRKLKSGVKVEELLKELKK